MSKLYIAYGSNMDLSQMAFRCPTAKLAGKAEVAGYRLLFRGSKTGAYATIEKTKNSNVPVLIWEITEADEINLDRYEGFPTFYYKKVIPVFIGGQKKRAMAYIMDKNRKPGLPSRHYYTAIENAYKNFGFDLGVLEKAIEDTIGEDDTSGYKKRNRQPTP